MKPSQIMLLGAAGALVLVMVVMFTLGRAAVGKGVPVDRGARNIPEAGRSGTDSNISESFSYAGFDRVVVEGAWSVKIRQSADSSVTVHYPPHLKDELTVGQRGSVLTLGSRRPNSRSDEGFRAEISMPVFSSLLIEGAGDVSFGGFDVERLDIQIDGAGRVLGEQSSVRTLNVELNGLGQIDLGGVSAENARAVLSGAGQIVLDMDGGVLDGSLEGLGQIQYSGDVSEERIKVDGMGNVRRIN